MARFSGQKDLAELEVRDPEFVGDTVTSLYEMSLRGKCKTNEELQDRIDEYFRYCAEHQFRPTIQSLCLALNVSRFTLYAWRSGRNCDSERKEIAQRAVALINSFLESAVMCGKINPASGIFFLKNYCGYSDTISIEQVSEQKEPKKDSYSDDDLREMLGIIGIDDLDDIEGSELP